MKKTVIAAACFAAAALFATPAWVAEKITFKSVSVDLPDGSSTLFPGAGADAINNNCLACHSTEMVLTQPALPKATWEAEVQKMIKTYKAPVNEADIGAIVDYLVKTKGKT